MDEETKKIIAELCELVADYLGLKTLEQKHWEARLKAMEAMDDYPRGHLHEELEQLRDRIRKAKDDLSKGDFRAELGDIIARDFKRLTEEHKRRTEELQADEVERVQKTQAVLGRMRDAIRQLATYLQE